MGVGDAFAGRVVLVTGAAHGIGEAIARTLHAAGAKVAVCDIDEIGAADVARDLDETGASATAIKLDVRAKSDFEEALSRVLARWSSLDIVVNNAGKGSQTPFEEIDVDEFDDIVAINMRSVFLSCQVFSRHMRENGYGRIVNVTSLSGQNGGTVAAAHYAASKAGAIMLSKYFAKQLAPVGITVNSVSPGPVTTSKSRMSHERIDGVAREIPIGRFVEVEEVAAAVMLLASDLGAAIVGATLDVNGGLLMR